MLQSVRRAQEYIAAGDAFQIVLARTFSTPTGDIDPFDIYRSLRVLNPSPYMYFLDLPPAPGETSRTQIAGASPETMVRLDGAVMTVRPLAGTRPRGRSEEEDSAFERDLLSDPKECAEHVMLIDLGRNDVGRVSEIGSVELNQTYLENRRSDRSGCATLRSSSSSLQWRSWPTRSRTSQTRTPRTPPRSSRAAAFM